MRIHTFVIGLLTSLILASCGNTSLAPSTTGEPDAGVLLRATKSVMPPVDINSPLTPTQAVNDTSTPQQTATVAPTLTPTPAPVIRQLTGDSCCVQPFWSPDSQKVLFIDRPSQDAQVGIWGVGLDGGAPQFITGRLGIYSKDYSFLAYLQSGQTFVERLSDGQRWVIPSSGRAVSFSPDGAWVTWTAGQDGSPFDSALRKVWVSRNDGEGARLVFQADGGGFSGWLPDGRMLVNQRMADPESGADYWILSLGDEAVQMVKVLELRGAGRVRSVQVSPGGHWLAYMQSFSEDPAMDGVWLVSLEDGAARRLDVFGAFQWQDNERLLVVPMEPDQTSHRLLQVQAASGEIKALTDVQVTPFKIGNGDWQVSPDGQKIVFVSAEDHNLWLITLVE